MSELAAKIKELEFNYSGDLLPKDSPFVVRLDGHKFSKFTKQLIKPCDPVFKNTMIKVAEDLLTEFNAVCAYTASDEITLVFPAVANEESTLIYKGRKQKICSLMAGYCSTRFNYWLREHADGSDLYTNKLGKAYFDARVFSTGDQETALDAVMWRYKNDTFVNGVSSIADVHFSHRELFKKNTKDKIDMLAAKNIMLNDHDPHLLYGTFVKKKLVTVMGKDPRTGEEAEVVRGRVYSQTYNLAAETREDAVTTIFKKYW